MAALDERKAFWVNLYNCLVMHATVVFGGADAEQRSAFFTGSSGAAYEVAGCASRSTTSSTASCAATRTRSAPRAALRGGRPADAVCAARARPAHPLCAQLRRQVVPADQLLQRAGLGGGARAVCRAFLESDLACDVENAEITCTKLLDWYGPDDGDGSRAKLERVCACCRRRARRCAAS